MMGGVRACHQPIALGAEVPNQMLHVVASDRNARDVVQLALNKAHEGVSLRLRQCVGNRSHLPGEIAIPHTAFVFALGLRLGHALALALALALQHDAAGPDVLGRYSGSLVTQHVIRQAVAVARLIGVPAPVHVRQVERPDGPQRTARREEFAD